MEKGIMGTTCIPCILTGVTSHPCNRALFTLIVPMRAIGYETQSPKKNIGRHEGE